MYSLGVLQVDFLHDPTRPYYWPFRSFHPTDVSKPVWFVSEDVDDIIYFGNHSKDQQHKDQQHKDHNKAGLCDMSMKRDFFTNTNTDIQTKTKPIIQHKNLTEHNKVGKCFPINHKKLSKRQ